MSASTLTAEPAAPLPVGWVEVASFPSLAEAEEHALVAVAVAESYWLHPTDRGFALLVEPAAARVVAGHLAAYARERVGWPPAPPADPAADRPLSLVSALVWAALVLGVHRLVGPAPETALLDARAILDHGEVWRVASALFVHADASHVISNVLTGVWVFAATVSTFGYRRGWCLIALAGIAANALLVALHAGSAYRSLGASTAIFAALGLLSGRALARRRAHTGRGRWTPLFLPLATGFVLLALFGGGTAPVDVGAHVAGFLAGSALAFVTHPFLRDSFPPGSNRPLRS